MCDPMVSAAWLKERLDAGDKIVILDVSFSNDQNYEEKFVSDHIPGARYFNFMHGVVSNEYMPRNIPSAAAFEAQARDLGIDGDSHVVVYDSTGNCGFYYGGRVWWLFRLFGHQQVSVLGGGIQSWTDAGFLTVNGQPDAIIRKGNFTAKFTDALIRGFEDMVVNLSDKSNQVLDTRPVTAFSGSSEDPRSGHIPGAKSLPFAQLLDVDNNAIKTREELTKAFVDAGIDLTKPFTVSCNSGMTSCTVALAAFMCGNESVSVYLGSFTEWQKRAALEHFEKL